jgi:thioredoxin reductase (NADPH)
MRIINPTFGTRKVEAETEASKAAKKPIDWRKDKVVLFSNSKPNAKEVLEGLNAKIDAVFKCGKFDFTSKGNAAVGATKAQLDEVASKYRGAILASGD